MTDGPPAPPDAPSGGDGPRPDASAGAPPKTPATAPPKTPATAPPKAAAGAPPEPPAGAASSPAARDRRYGDRLALAAIGLGAAVALLGLRAPLTLSSGCAIALAGVLLAIRGDRPVPAPALLSAALAVAVAALAAVALLAVWEEWQIGQQLAEGTPLSLVQSAVRPYTRLGAGLRSLALFSALSLLLGAATTRLGSSGK